MKEEHLIALKCFLGRLTGNAPQRRGQVPPPLPGEPCPFLRLQHQACKPRPRESSQLTPGLRTPKTAVIVTNRDLSGPLSPLPENKERRRMRSMNGQQAPPVCGAPGSSLGFPASSPPRHLQRKPERTLRASRTCSLLARGRGGETEAPCGAGGAAAQGAPRLPL